MKKNKKIRRLIYSFSCFISTSLSLTIGLSSCVLSTNNGGGGEDSDNDNIVTPPDDDGNNEGDNGGGGEDSDNDNIVTPPDDDGNNEGDNGGGDGITNPDKPDPSPEIKPPIDNKPDHLPPNSNLINSESIKLKNYKQLLPSQYLLNINDLSDLSVDRTKIKENFDATKVLNVKYTISSLNDLNGSLSIKMSYESSINNNLYEFIFKFTDLSRLENQNYNLYFDITNKNLLNAKEISDTIVQNDSESKLFFNYLREKGANLVFKNDNNNLPIEYLDFSNGLTFNGFNNNWFESNNDLELHVKPKLLKINIYEKNESSNNIIVRQKNYPTNLVGSSRKPIKLICPSALDYLLEQIVTNSTYKEDKFASYYYYDILYNQQIESQLQLSNDRWLKNVKYDINGTNKKYRPVFSKTINPNIDSNGNLIIQIQMQLEDKNVFSTKSKELIIESFQRMSANLFSYDNDKGNKFNLFCEGSNQDEILNNIKDKSNFNLIKNKIDTSNGEIVDLSSYFNALDHTKFKKFIKLYFGDSEIIESNNFFNSIDKKISIKKYLISYYDSKNVIIQYNKISKCFQTKCIVTIESKGIDIESSTSKAITVNITKINKQLP